MAIKAGYDQFVPPGMYLDRDTWLILPLGVRPAGKGRAAASWFLGVGLLIVTLGVGYLAWSAVAWRQGQTPAQRLLGLRCWWPDTRRAADRQQMTLRQVTGLLLNGQAPVGPAHLAGQPGPELGGRPLRRHPGPARPGPDPAAPRGSLSRAPDHR